MLVSEHATRSELGQASKQASLRTIPGHLPAGSAFEIVGDPNARSARSLLCSQSAVVSAINISIAAHHSQAMSMFFLVSAADQQLKRNSLFALLQPAMSPHHTSLGKLELILHLPLLVRLPVHRRSVQQLLQHVRRLALRNSKKCLNDDADVGVLEGTRPKEWLLTSVMTLPSGRREATRLAVRAADAEQSQKKASFYS